MELRPDGTMILAIAVSRSGKSVFVKEVLAGHKRVIAFDPKGEYVAQLGYQACYTPEELQRALMSAGKGSAKIAFVATDAKSFDFFCGCALTWNKIAMCAIVCEELAAVTTCGKASGNWGRLINQGLAYGPLIIGTVQRGQEVDKTLMNNATFLHVMRHSTDDDRDYIARKLGLAVTDIPGTKLEFIQWSSDRGLVCKGKIDFTGKPREGWPQVSPIFKRTDSQRAQRLTFNKDKTGRFRQIIYA